MPDKDWTSFYILQYYRSGNDGTVCLACTPDGRLCVLKLPNKTATIPIRKERDLWNEIWKTDCFIVEICNREVLVMPFCFQGWAENKTIALRELESWQYNRHRITNIGKANNMFFDYISDLCNLDYDQLMEYEKEPMKVVREAITTMHKAGYQHLSIRWNHFALLPVYSPDTSIIHLKPILIDLSKTTKVSPSQSVSTFLSSTEKSLIKKINMKKQKRRFDEI